ncbi:hypothetical protein D1010_12370 [Schleiferilactobacillus harbinensis]|uniref:Uncharacterized protein n=2 Tax=Schleiferilactobacillus harbinensis TaxID=304207 RepID=A0A5P8MBH1_9LACO|nr:hypothetical protein D1010_12370 [Schleiferilactobacillus harbinensis]
MKETEEQEFARRRYLSKFQRENAPARIVDPRAKDVGERIVLLMKKEDLTYDAAYASLQYAYELIRYESNFLKLG